MTMTFTDDSYKRVKRLLEENRHQPKVPIGYFCADIQRYAPIKIIGIKIIVPIIGLKFAVTGLGPYKIQVKIS